MINRVVILQPTYIPWLGFFDQINKSNIFVFFDDVQYTRRDWRNRNYIKDKNESRRILTVPVKTKGKYYTKIKDIEIRDDTWIKQHMSLIKESYRHSPFYNSLFPILEKIFYKNYQLLSNLDIDLTLEIVSYLGIDHVTFVQSSKLDIQFEDPTMRIIKICKKLHATHYLTGNSAKNYLRENEFKKNNILLEYQNYIHPKYIQQGNIFIPNLSIIDLIFNEGKKSLQILANKIE